MNRPEPEPQSRLANFFAIGIALFAVLFILAYTWRLVRLLTSEGAVGVIVFLAVLAAILLIVVVVAARFPLRFARIKRKRRGLWARRGNTITGLDEALAALGYPVRRRVSTVEERGLIAFVATPAGLEIWLKRRAPHLTLPWDQIGEITVGKVASNFRPTTVINLHCHRPAVTAAIPVRFTGPTVLGLFSSRKRAATLAADLRETVQRAQARPPQCADRH